MTEEAKQRQALSDVAEDDASAPTSRSITELEDEEVNLKLWVKKRQKIPLVEDIQLVSELNL